MRSGEKNLFTIPAKLALTALDKLALKRLSFGGGEQAEQASAAVTLQQQSIIAALVAGFKCGLRCHNLKFFKCHLQTSLAFQCFLTACRGGVREP